MLALSLATMKSYVTALLVLAPLAGVGVLVGCAEGADVDPAESFISTGPVEAGKGEDDDDSVTMPPPSNPPEDDDPDDDPEVDAGGGKGGPDGGAGDGGTKPDAGGGGGGNCTATNKCITATDLGSVSGDTGSDTKSAQGHTSQWFTVRVTENHDGFGSAGRSLKLTAELTSPAGTNYDVYLYVPASDTQECSAVSGQSTSTTVNDSANVRFGEGDGDLFGNGSKDDRTVTVEVRHVSGTCDPNQKWSLTLTGNK